MNFARDQLNHLISRPENVVDARVVGHYYWIGGSAEECFVAFRFDGNTYQVKASRIFRSRGYRYECDSSEEIIDCPEVFPQVVTEYRPENVLRYFPDNTPQPFFVGKRRNGNA